MKPTYVLGEYAEWVVPTAVAHVVQDSWTYAAGAIPADLGEPTVHRVIPHNGVSLVVHGRRDAMGRFRADGIQLQGATSTYHFFRPCYDTTLVAVRLRPEWANAVLGLDAVELKDGAVDVEGHGPWRSAFSRIRRLRDAGAVLRSLERLVYDRLSEVQADGAGITAHRALESIRADPMSGRVAGLAKAAGVSERTLHRSVTSLTGMSPKWIQRVERLSRAVTTTDRVHRPNWSDVAFRFGFSDQAHLVREARALTGCTPLALHRERRLQHRGPDRSTRPPPRQRA